VVPILTHKFGDRHRASLLINNPFLSFEKEGFNFFARRHQGAKNNPSLVIPNSFQDPSKLVRCVTRS
jgi:hypothetical protein